MVSEILPALGGVGVRNDFTPAVEAGGLAFERPSRHFPPVPCTDRKIHRVEASRAKKAVQIRMRKTDSRTRSVRLRNWQSIRRGNHRADASGTTRALVFLIMNTHPAASSAKGLEVWNPFLWHIKKLSKPGSVKAWRE